jgi:hypothetical protein
MYQVIDLASKGKKVVCDELTLHQAKAEQQKSTTYRIVQKGKKWKF